MWTADDVIAEGDRVVARVHQQLRAEQLFGVPSVGVRQVFAATCKTRIQDGRVAETWRNADALGRLLQLDARIVP